MSWNYQLHRFAPMLFRKMLEYGTLLSTVHAHVRVIGTAMDGSPPAAATNLTAARRTLAEAGARARLEETAVADAARSPDEDGRPGVDDDAPTRPHGAGDAAPSSPGHDAGGGESTPTPQAEGAGDFPLILSVLHRNLCFLSDVFL